MQLEGCKSILHWGGFWKNSVCISLFTGNEVVDIIYIAYGNCKVGRKPFYCVGVT